MLGRPPKPTDLKLIEGNRGKRALNASEPKPKARVPRVPDHLSQPAKDEWQRITRELGGLGLLTHIDRAALAGYCQAWADWVEAEEQLQKYGRVVRTPSRTVTRRKPNGETETEQIGGSVMQSPYLSIRNRALEFMHKFLIEFGMSPASRTRISLDNGPKIPDRDKAKRYFTGR